MNRIRRLGGHLLDHPSTVTLILGAVVAIHFGVSKLWIPELSPSLLFDALDPASLPTAVASLALGVAGVAAMVGGFAGVVVVFGLSSDDERFRLVRLNASTSLRRNWMSIVTTPLAAAFGALLAAASATAWRPGAALWILEACLLLVAHGAMRLVILLNELVRVVHFADEAAQRAANTVDDEEFFKD